MVKKLYKKSRVLGGVALAAFGLATILMICGFSNTLSEVGGAVISRTPDAILASAGLTDGRTVSLPVIYFDQKADDCVNAYDKSEKAILENRQFEWTECGYYNKDVEQGIVDYYLDDDLLPVARGGKLVVNRGVVGDNGDNSNFKRWFNAVEGKSVSYAGLLQMDYKEANAEFSFYKKEFYPLDDVENALGEKKTDSHNHLFTMDFGVPFTALNSGHESFEITADDDTFVFVGNRLAIDMGGIHDAVDGRLVINNNGEVYSSVGDEDLAFTGIVLEDDAGSMVRIFHADRDSESSVFKIRFSGMNLTVMDSKMAKDDGIQIAYDPNDPTFVAPLGESMVVKPSAIKGHIILATLEGVFIVIFAVLLAVSARFMVKSQREKKED